MGIAPLEADLVAMQRTLRRLETLVNERRAQDIDTLISPRVTEPHQQGIVLATRSFIADLPRDAQFHLRTDVGRGAVVPIGPERVQIQVSSTIERGTSRRTGRVDVELEAVEQRGQRQWLLVELVFPGQSPILTGGFPVGHLVAIVAVVALPIIAIIGIVIRRRRRARQDERDSQPSTPAE